MPIDLVFFTVALCCGAFTINLSYMNLLPDSQVYNMLVLHKFKLFINLNVYITLLFMYDLWPARRRAHKLKNNIKQLQLQYK